MASYTSELLLRITVTYSLLYYSCFPLKSFVSPPVGGEEGREASFHDLKLFVCTCYEMEYTTIIINNSLIVYYS